MFTDRLRFIFKMLDHDFEKNVMCLESTCIISHSKTFEDLLDVMILEKKIPSVYYY